MMDLNDYFYFVHVVEKGGFSRAAESLNMPKSRLSRHVAKLEERLDIKLIQRSSRQFKVTDSGMLFYQHAQTVIENVEAAEAAMLQKKGSLSGRITLSCSVGLAQFALKGLLVNFLKDNPKVALMQQVTNQSVDLIGAGVDIAIRGHAEPLPDSSYIQRHLAEVAWQLVASPSYLKEKGTPQVPSDLRQHESLQVGWQNYTGQWQLENSSGAKEIVSHRPSLCTDDMSTLIQAAEAGLGVVSLPSYICRHEVQKGSLIEVLPSWHTGKAQLSLILPSRKRSSAAVAHLCDFLIETLQAEVETKY